MKKLLFSFFLFFFLLNISYANELLKIANQLVQKGKYEQSEKLYFKIIKDNTGNKAVVYFNMANMYYRWKKMGQAIVYYEKTIEKAPRFKSAYLNIGKIHFQYGNYTDALKVFQKYYKINSQDWLTLLLLADVCSILGMSVEAERYYQSASLVNPNDFQAYYEMSTLYEDLQDVKVALRYLTTGIDLAENELPLLLYQAELFYQEKKYNEANVIYDTILSGNYELSKDERYRYRIQRGNLLMILGLTNSYIDILTELLEEYPQKSRAKDLLYNVAIDNNRLDIYLEKIIALYPQNKIFYIDIRKMGLYAYQKQEVELMQMIYDFYLKEKINSDQIFLNIKRFLKS